METQKLEKVCNEEDVSIPVDHIQQSVNSPLSIDMKLSNGLEGCHMENDQHNSCFESGKRSPTLIELLREMSNRFKTLSSQPISKCASKIDGSCSMQFTIDSVEPKTPRLILSSKLDCNLMVESFTTPQEKFKTRSTILKKSLVDECLDFLNSASKKLINAASPLMETQKLEKICNEEVVSIPVDHIQQSVNSPLSIGIKLSNGLEGCHMENDQYNSCFESGKRSPTLTELLREMSNRFKTLSSRPISKCASKIDGSCSMQFTIDSVEPKTPRLILSSKLDCNLMVESFTTPQEKFKTRSTILKKSLVDECLDFLNSASKEELKQLKGIGEKRATYIIELH